MGMTGEGLSVLVMVIFCVSVALYVVRQSNK